jgi:hypothetical protein
MKAIKFLSIFMFAFALPMFVSCGDDEDEPLESVIIGKWYSYKATVSNSYGKRTVDVTQNGEYAAFYMEVSFASNKTVIVKSWLQSEDGVSFYWGETSCVYIIDDDELTIVDENGEKIFAKYYPKDNNIVWTLLTKDIDTGNLITTNLFFKK